MADCHNLAKTCLTPRANFRNPAKACLTPRTDFRNPATASKSKKYLYNCRNFYNSLYNLS